MTGRDVTGGIPRWYKTSIAHYKLKYIERESRKEHIFLITSHWFPQKERVLGRYSYLKHYFLPPKLKPVTGGCSLSRIFYFFIFFSEKIPLGHIFIFILKIFTSNLFLMVTDFFSFMFPRVSSEFSIIPHRLLCQLV